ncbi:hypothetical protein NLU13_2750 [Sarocladium strictum]|uniref:Zn(2)-C6 fungal-type domain-containing protein n=1 Tax=Sarocladium strictum TaxID=5046 RepID=A0AA39GKR3_SARSR|nr:hypothetical protein NLU13_2750 [Sarocladium strictum]
MISTKPWDQIGRLADGKCTGSSHHHSSVALAPRAMYFQAEEPASPMSKRKHKRRAARACLACRARKVRCDVVESIPCRNCKWDGIDCVLQEGRRKHKNAGPASKSPSAGLTFIVVPAEGDVRQEAVHSPPGSSKSQSVFDESEVPTLTPSTNPPSTADDEEMCDVVTRAIPSHHSETAKSSSCHGCPRQPHSLGQLLSSMAGVLRKSSWDADHTPSPEAVQARESIVKALPKFITPPPVDLDLDSLRHLRSSRAFQLPSSASQCELLRAYARGVHYSMPCVDLHDVIRAQSSRSGSRGSISLVLYQSLMFAGAMYVKSKVLKDMGYASRPAALKDLYRRAKLLYSLEYDKEPLSIVQTLLLLSLRSPSSSKQDTPSFCTHLAIGVIRQEKMHCEASRAALPKHEASIWKRLWWCCIVRDTFNALGGCHAPSIRGDDCEISFLELDDFDVAPLPTSGPSDPSACTTEEQTRLAELFIELGDLSLRLARVLHHQFRGLGPNAPADDDDDELIGSLKQWYQDLPPSCHAESPPVTSWNDRVSLVDVQRCFLHMTYHAALLTIHRNGIVPAVTSVREDPGTSLAAQSANSILQIAAGLVASELDDLMPVMGVTLLLPALLVHSLDAAAHATNYEIAQDAHQSMRILEKMKDRFEFAHMAACYLQPFREASHESSRAKETGHGEEPDHAAPTARLSVHSSLPNSSTTPRCVGTEIPDLTAASSSMVDALGDPSPDYLQASHFDPKVLEELDSLSAEAYSFEQLMENSLDDAPDFANWTSSSPAANDSKDHPIHSPSHVDVVKSQQSDGRAQDIFHHIEEEIVQILALN